MSVDMHTQIPTLTDDGLATLRANAHRLAASGEAKQQAAAQDLLPAIEAEIAKRKAEKPPRAKAGAGARAPKARARKL